MHFSSYLCFIGTAALCACSTTSKSSLPDGSSRVPVNSRIDIDNYTALFAKEASVVDTRSATERHLAGLRSDVESIKLQMATMQLSRASSGQGRGQVIAHVRLKRQLIRTGAEGKKEVAVTGNTTSTPGSDEAAVPMKAPRAPVAGGAR